MKAANIDFVPAFLPGMFSKVLSNNPRQLLMNIGSSLAPVAPIAANNNNDSTCPKEETKVEQKEESSSESEADMGFGLFD